MKGKERGRREEREEREEGGEGRRGGKGGEKKRGCGIAQRGQSASPEALGGAEALRPELRETTAARGWRLSTSVGEDLGFDERLSSSNLWVLTRPGGSSSLDES